MTSYDPPDIQGLPFNFTEGGYSPPDFSQVPFNFGQEGTSDSAYLSAAVQVMQMYTTTTYSEVKECRTIVIGYGPGGIQTLQLPCEYLGIRDVLSSIHGNLWHADLWATLTPQAAFSSDVADILSAIKSFTSSYSDLPGLLHGWDLSDLNSLLQGYAVHDLESYISVRQRSTSDIVSAIREVIQSYADLSQQLVSFKGYQIPYDLYGELYSIPPSDLLSYLNVIEIKDLNAEIYPQKYKGESVFESFLRGLHTGVSDLYSLFHGWDTSDIQGVVTCAHVADLPGEIRGSITEALLSYIYSVSPEDILSHIHGFDFRSIPSYIIGAYGKEQLLGSIYGIPPSDLPSFISVFKELGAQRTISSYLESYHAHDLWSTIHYIEPVGLQSIITARGSYKNLDVLINPKVVFVRQSIFVNILESRVLHSGINSKCFASAYRDISHNLYAYDKLDLRAIIRPRLTDEDNQKDLTAYINYGYLAEDTITIKTFVANRYIKIPIDINRTSTAYKTDTIQITFSSNFDNFRDVGTGYKFLSSYVRGMPVHSDLTSRIVPTRDFDLVGIGSKTNYKNHLLVLDISKSYENWTRDLDIYFNTIATQYFYAQDGGAIFRVDRSAHVTICVEGYSVLSSETLGIERGNIRRKIVFNLSNYNTIDAAIRDAIDRVGSLRSSDLYCYINTTGIVGNYSSIGSYILPLYSIRTVRSIISSLTGIEETMIDLPCSITGEYNKTDIGSEIVPCFYTVYDPLSADFNFTVEDLTSVGDSYVDFTFEVDG